VIRQMIRHRSLRDLDWTLLIVVLIVCSVGILQIYSSLRGTDSHNAWLHQILFIVGGLFLMWLVLASDYHALLHHVPLMYVISLVALLGTYLVGEAAFGSRRWIPLVMGFHLQVSEFVKLVIILLVARYLTDLRTDDLEIREMLKLAGLVLLPAALVFKQPDMGTALTYIAVLMVGAFLAGLHWKYVAAMVIIGALAVIIAPHFLQGYQRARLESFVAPEQDPQGAGYQVIQSQTAIGSGGMFGKGVTKGTQAQLHFLPVPDKDFIFSAFAEEHGFVGVVVMLALYFVMVMRIVQNAQTAPERAGMYICMGVAALLLFHILTNVGMVAGLMPVTGIPLPFMSRGGSSIWASFLALGLVNNVRLRRFVN
jgi:rod shape determining protein RodA